VATRPTSRSRSRSKAEREFVSEAEEILERMRGALLDLAEQRDAGREADPELVNGLFRSAHSLKGLSGMFGFDAMGELAHHLEDVLDRLRMGQVDFDAQASALLEESVQLVAASLTRLGDEGAHAETERSIADLVGRIEVWLRAPQTDASGLVIDPVLLRTLTEYEEHRLRHNMAQGRRIHQIETCHDLQTFDRALSELAESIRAVGELISTLPSAAGGDRSELRFVLLAASELEASALAAHLGLDDISVSCTWEPGEASAASPRPSAAKGAEPAGELETLKSIGETVRVDIRKLDELMNLVGELMIQRRTLASLAGKFLAETQTSRLGSELDKLNKAFERKLQELQAGVLEVRMVPLRQIFDKLSRAVRRLQRDTDKEVRLELRGADTELDKFIVEELVDPLVHVVRNAFDHALETTEERAAAGKPATGLIRVEASQIGSDVVITVLDDGRGIDAERVYRRAVECGLAEASATLTEKEKLELIFAPGLSTRDEVTETSGRGVGMDVVRSNLTAVGGIVGVDSIAGVGTTLTLTLPITLAIVQALIVSVGSQRFAIPLNSVHETLFVSEAELQRSRSRELLDLRGEALPIRRLWREFELPEPEAPDKMSVVVLAVGGLRMGLLVHRLEGQQDAVIKPIHGPIADVRGIAGATELGDGEAVLVLDVAALVEDATRGRDAK
jgi:two-component system chemotaxis sensor kinase CheA